jgi:hypothetical protein
MLNSTILFNADFFYPTSTTPTVAGICVGGAELVYLNSIFFPSIPIKETHFFNNPAVSYSIYIRAVTKSNLI